MIVLCQPLTDSSPSIVFNAMLSTLNMALDMTCISLLLGSVSGLLLQSTNNLYEALTVAGLNYIAAGELV